MNKLLKIFVSIGLCVSLTIGATASGYADEEIVKHNEKDETVYALAGADGSINKIIVSDHLTNHDGADKITDKSNLENIENVKGDETFSRSDDSITWEADGSDIYYQGTTDKELPVSLKVTYTLDGKTVSAKDIAGKSGQVTMRFDFDNRMTETLGDEEVCIPFVTLTAPVLDNEVFKNIAVSGGKIMDDGDKTVIVGYTFPGLQESFNLPEDKINLPEYFEITADAENFRLANTFTVITNSVFSNIDFDKSDSSENLGQLSDGMSQLIDGSNQLAEGMAELLEKSGELIQGTEALANGSSALEAGAEALYSGSGELEAGAEQLCGGLDTLTDNNDTLTAGAKQVFDTLLASADAQLKAAGLELPALTVENYNAILDGVIAKLGDKAEAIKTLKQSLDSYNAFYTGLLSYTAGVEEAANGAENLKKGVKNLRAGVSELSTGAKELNSGMSQLKSSISALINGMTQLSDGANKLCEGIIELDEKGISKIATLGGTLEKFKGLQRISQEYTNFSGIDSSCEGSVKFIIRTESIE